MPQWLEVDRPRVAPSLLSIRILGAIDALDAWLARTRCNSSRLLRWANSYRCRNSTSGAKIATERATTSTGSHCHLWIRCGIDRILSIQYLARDANGRYASRKHNVQAGDVVPSSKFHYLKIFERKLFPDFALRTFMSFAFALPYRLPGPLFCAG